MEHVNNPYFLVNDKWNVDFIGEIKQFKMLAENYNHSTQNIHFRIKSSTVNLEAKYFWYHELFYAEKALVTIFVGQCWSVFTKFLNEKYPTLFSLLDLSIDKVEREWLFWLHEQKYKTQEIQKHAFRAEVTRKTHLAGYLRLFLSKFLQLTDTLEQSQAPTPKQVKREMNDANKDVIIETLKRKIKALENENKELREEMKKAYAQVYDKF